MAEYREHLWRDIRDECEKECREYLSPCETLKKLENLHRNVEKKKLAIPPPKALELTGAVSAAEAVKWIEDMNYCRRRLMSDIIDEECDRRCKDRMKGCEILGGAQEDA